MANEVATARIVIERLLREVQPILEALQTADTALQTADLVAAGTLQAQAAKSAAERETKEIHKQIDALRRDLLDANAAAEQARASAEARLAAVAEAEAVLASRRLEIQASDAGLATARAQREQVAAALVEDQRLLGGARQEHSRVVEDMTRDLATKRRELEELAAKRTALEQGMAALQRQAALIAGNKV